MGVDHYVLDKPGFQDDHQNELDIIICTRDAADGFPLQEYIQYVIPGVSHIQKRRTDNIPGH